MTLQEILESVKSGSVSVEEAERILKKESYEEMGYAKLDTSRKARTGFAEMLNGFMMWESAECIVYSPDWRRSRVRTV